MNRAWDDEWPIELPVPSTPTWQQNDTSKLQRLKRPRSTHPPLQPGNGNQLPPIRNLVPGLWEPGTSRSSRLITPDEGKNRSSVYRLRPVDTVWSDQHMNENSRDNSRQVNESNKRHLPSPTERVDHARSASLSGITNSNRGAIGHARKTSRKLNQLGEKHSARLRSNSGAAETTAEYPESDSRSSHHQEVLRDPHSALRQLLAPQPMTINELHHGRDYGASKRVLRSGS